MPLPSEIWSIVFDKVLEDDELLDITLGNICTTCRELQSLSQPLVFRKLRYIASQPETEARAQGMDQIFKRNTSSRYWPKEIYLQFGIGGRAKSKASEIVMHTARLQAEAVMGLAVGFGPRPAHPKPKAKPEAVGFCA